MAPPPPPFRMQTRGQANIKPPQRYEGIIAQGESDEEQYHPPTAPRRLSAYRGKFIEYNPNLPPAAFPTLELGQERREASPAKTDTTMRNLPPEQTDRNLPCEMHTFMHSDFNRFSTFPLHRLRVGNSGILNPTVDTGFHRSRNTQEPTNKVGKPILSRGTAVMPRTANPMEGPSTQGEQRWDTKSNNMSNPVYANNVRIMQQLGARTEDDWNIAEMETSDEEEASARNGASTSARIRRSPQEMVQLWDELSVAFKLDLLDIMEQAYETRAEAMQGLHLNAIQCQELLHHLEEQNGQIDAEDKAIESLQSETRRILLSRSGEQLKNVTQTGFRNMLEEGLYQVRGSDYYTATSAEIAKATEYLSYCGQEPELLGHWISVMGTSVDGANGGNPQDSTIKRFPNGDKLVSERVSSVGHSFPEAAFPTKTSIPVQQSSRGTTINTSQIIGNFPVEPQYLAPPSQLSISLTPPNSVVRPLDLHKPADVPRTSEMQTPNITPDSLVPPQASINPESVPASGKPAVKDDSEGNEEPPPKKRAVPANNRKLPQAGSILINTVSAPKASTKSRRRVTFTPTSTVAPGGKKDDSTPMTASINSLSNDATPPATASPTARRKSMAPPPKPTPSSFANDNTASTQPPATENPNLSIDNTIPNTQTKTPRRRKTATAAAEPKAPKPAPAPKATRPSNRRKSAPITTRRAAAGKSGRGSTPRNGGEDDDTGANGIINGRS